MRALAISSSSLLDPTRSLLPDTPQSPTGHTCTNMYISAAQSDVCLMLVQKQRNWRSGTCSTQRLPWVLTTPLAYSTSYSRQLNFRWCS